MSVLSPEALRELRRLYEAATPGEWIADKRPGDYDMVRQKAWVLCGQPDHQDCAIVQTMESVALPNISHPERAADNARFIAEAHNALPLLLDEIERLRAQEIKPTRDCDNG